MSYKEFGGYIELDTYTGTEFHSSAIALNCGRNCLAYLIRTKNIHKLYIPYFLCSSVANVCRKYDVEVKYYHINYEFRPLFEQTLCEGEFLYIVNLFGQINNKEIIEWKQRYPNLIIDNAQAYFQMPIGNLDTIYTCRKYFGVADGAYLYTNKKIDLELETDCSFERMRFLLGRFEKEANEFYTEYVDNNMLFKNEPIKLMSKLTHNLLRGINYATVLQRREENFEVLNQLLHSDNKLKLVVPQGAFMYPLYAKNGAFIKKRLIQKKIYIPTLWPDVFDACTECDLEYELAKNILPIPVDQRYSQKDMEYLAEVIMKCID